MKKVLISVALIIILAIGVLLVAPSFVDWSAYRTEISQQIKTKTGRDLIIGGDIEFSLLPAPVLKVSDIRLSNAQGASRAEMAAIRQLDVRLDPLPLLGGTVRISSVRLIEPQFYLEKLEDGSGNWTFSQNTTAPKTPGDGVGFISPSAQQTSGESDLPLQIDSFIIENGELVYRDDANGIEETLKSLNARFSMATLKGPFEAEGTVNLHDVDLAFQGTVGQIVNNRSASFALKVQTPHGSSEASASGTFVNLSAGPKITSKLDIKGDSLAGLINGLSPQKTWPKAMMRPYQIKGDVIGTSTGVDFGENGLTLQLGEDRAKIDLSFQSGDMTQFTSRISASKIDLDAWLEGEAQSIASPPALKPLIEPSSNLMSQKGKTVSSSLSPSQDQKDAAPSPQPETSAPQIPEGIKGALDISIDALLIKNKAIRQLEGKLSLEDGTLALERLGAVLPGAGEVSIVGVSGERDGTVQFDGSLDLKFANLRGALDWLGISTRSVPSDRLQQLSVSSEIVASPKEVRFLKTRAAMDGSRLTGGARIALSERPSFGLSATLDRLNLDAYQSQGTPADPGPATPSVQGSSKAQPTADKPSDLPKALSVFDMLSAFDANINLSLEQLTYQAQQINNIAIDATVYDATLRLRSAKIGDLAGARVDLSGDLAKTDKGVLANNLKATLKAPSVERIAKLASAPDALDWQALGGVAISATLNGNLMMPSLDVTLEGAGTSAFVSGDLDLLPQPSLAGSLNLSSANPKRFFKALKLEPQMAGPLGTLSVEGEISAHAKEVRLSALSAKMGSSDLSGALSFKPGAPARLDGKLSSNVLHLDALLPGESSSAPSATTQRSAQGASSSPSQGAPSAQRWSNEPLALGGLSSTEAELSYNIAKLTYKGTTSEDVSAGVTLRAGRLDLALSSPKSLNGQLSSKLSVQAMSDTSADIALSFDATNLALSEALKLSPKQIQATGRIDLKADLKTRGKSERELVSGLTGPVSLDLQNTRVQKTGNQASVLDLLNFLSALSGTSPDKGLADVTLRSQVSNGIASLETARLTSSIATGTAQGKIDLPAWMLDVKGQFDISQNALGAVLAQAAKLRKDYPFSVNGPLDKPNVKLETGGITSGKGLVIPLPDKIDKDNIGGILKGILGVQAPPAQQAPAQENPPSDTQPPPPPPPSGSQNSSPPSVEEQLLRGLGNFLQNR